VQMGATRADDDARATPDAGQSRRRPGPQLPVGPR